MLNELPKITERRAKRVGRGTSSGKGKTSGRGVKGQKSRSGVAIKGFEGGQMPMIARLPKRGFRSRSTKFFTPINFVDITRLAVLNKIKEGDLIDKALLVTCGVIKSISVKVKLLSHGELGAKFDFQLDAYSASAKDAVLKIGGKIN